MCLNTSQHGWCVVGSTRSASRLDVCISAKQALRTQFVSGWTGESKRCGRGPGVVDHKRVVSCLPLVVYFFLFLAVRRHI